MSPRAPKRCGRSDCDVLVVGKTYCPEHSISWATSTGHARTSTTQWKRTRTRIMRRDNGICYVCGDGNADTVDHIVAVADGGSDDDSNLGAIHDRNSPHCHRRKTAAEGHAAMRRLREKVRHPVEQHPAMAAR